MTIIKNIIRSILMFFAIMGFAAGIFLIVIGFINGFGEPTLPSKALWVLAGTALSAACLYSLYVLYGRSWQKLIDTMFDGVLLSLFR